MMEATKSSGMVSWATDNGKGNGNGNRNGIGIESNNQPNDGTKATTGTGDNQPNEGMARQRGMERHGRLHRHG
jgi:hypothetical protein